MAVAEFNITMQLLGNMEMIHSFFSPISNYLHNITELLHRMVNANQPEIYLRAHSISQW